MKINIIVGYIVVVILGILFHYSYDYFDIPSLKVIFPQNESIFEHLKLLFYPVIIYMIIDLLIIRKYNELAFRSYITGLFLALLFTIASFYTYSGMIGNNFLFVDILIFLISILIVFYYRYKKITLFSGLSSILVFVILFGMMIIFTYYPSNINFFLPL